jgi:hypothetical protein
MSCDRVIIIDEQTCLFIHVYVLEEWNWIPILLNLQKVINKNFWQLHVLDCVESCWLWRLD